MADEKKDKAPEKESTQDVPVGLPAKPVEPKHPYDPETGRFLDKPHPEDYDDK